MKPHHLLLSALLLTAALPGAPAAADSVIPDAQARPATFSMPPLGSYAAVIERPLFTKDRRPRQVQAMAAGPIGPVSLSGIVITRARRYAVIRDEGAAAGQRIVEGQRIGAGIVKRILADRIVIANGNSESVIRLFDRATTKGPAPSPVQSSDIPVTSLEQISDARIARPDLSATHTAEVGKGGNPRHP